MQKQTFEPNGSRWEAGHAFRLLLSARLSRKSTVFASGVLWQCGQEIIPFHNGRACPWVKSIPFSQGMCVTTCLTFLVFWLLALLVMISYSLAALPTSLVLNHLTSLNVMIL